MTNRYSSIILGLLLIFTGCQPDSSKREYKSHEPKELEAFVAAMRHSFDTPPRIEVPRDRGDRRDRGLRASAHKDLFEKFPVYYDWWLQDGDSVNWFDGKLSGQLTVRLQKLNVPVVVEDTPESLQNAFSLYVEACIERRKQRLNSFTENNPEIVFTKFEVLRPSFFAYTEGLSDARDECNFFPGGELSLIKMNGIWAEEETLLSDSIGVFRDPDIHFDGKHILFSWKKSLKEDDFHLYEMEMPSRKVKQLTYGLGFADIEPIYLPDENIMFNSTRSGNSVDCWTVEVSNLFLCNRDGEYMRRIGYDQVHTVKPAEIGRASCRERV